MEQGEAGGMRVLVGCEFSGTVRDAFRAQGHDAYSCDILPAEGGSPFHVMGDVRDILADGWDLAIFHPPCTRLTVAGARWFKGKEAEQAEAIAFVETLWAAPVPRIAIENPIGVLSTRSTLGKPTQIIQPWQFGHEETKATCLWLKGLPPLVPSNIKRPPKKSDFACDSYYYEAWAKWQRVHRMPPGPHRWRERSRTYQGIADAMAAQWGRA